uniref:Nanos-type domain-containing protein n=1 Tax=viral metagenome TaxID=1070528 RepID=A0A6C0IIH7_9ZZZZ
MKSQQQSSKSAIRPFCKFCEGAGESKAVYTSHWQFSKPTDGVLTCPKLLNYKCKNCNACGHIEKRCQVARKQQQPYKGRDDKGRDDKGRDDKGRDDKAHSDKKFCRFCYNAKNPDFLEHNQFNNDGVVQCPTLLEIECQVCGVKGHTKRYCPGPVEKPVITTTLHVNSMDLFPMLTPTLGEKGNALMLGGWSKIAANSMPVTPANSMPVTPANSMPPNKPVPHPPSKIEQLLKRTPPNIPVPEPPAKIEDDSSDDEEEETPYKLQTTSWADCE